MNAHQRRLEQRRRRREYRAMAGLPRLVPKLTQWLSNQNHVRVNLQPVVVVAPKFISLNAKYRVATRKPLRVGN